MCCDSAVSNVSTGRTRTFFQYPRRLLPFRSRSGFLSVSLASSDFSESTDGSAVVGSGRLIKIGFNYIVPSKTNPFKKNSTTFLGISALLVLAPQMSNRLIH